MNRFMQERASSLSPIGQDLIEHLRMETEELKRHLAAINSANVQMAQQIVQETLKASGAKAALQFYKTTLGEEFHVHSSGLSRLKDTGHQDNCKTLARGNPLVGSKASIVRGPRTSSSQDAARVLILDLGAIH
ncbi:hypothetical protein B0H11DRAFT_1920922 [Mycena galericulata]|nr:hypothetical protein B0H11DRAFT_1920922 [Mycena galericulata]